MTQLRDNSAINILGKNVRKYRHEKKMTLEMLAIEAGVEYSQISRIERCVINTSVSVIFAIAKALDVKPSLLLEE